MTQLCRDKMVDERKTQVLVPLGQENSLDCPECGSKSFRIFTEEDGTGINSVECADCHTMFGLNLSPGPALDGAEA